MQKDLFPVVDRMLARAIAWRLAMPEVADDIEALVHALRDHQHDVAALRSGCPCAWLLNAERSSSLMHDAVEAAGEGILRRDMEIEALRSRLDQKSA